MGDRSVYCVAGLRLTIKERDTAKDEGSIHVSRMGRGLTA